jgi:hypothetical protein
MATLTAANSIILIGVENLFPIPQQMQGFAADDVMDLDGVEPAEVSMGVDGFMSAGWVPVPRRQMITLQADSASNAFFDAWAAGQEAARELYIANGIIRLPSIGMSFALVRGVLTTYKPAPPVRRILQPRQHGITWGSVTAAPI